MQGSLKLGLIGAFLATLVGIIPPSDTSADHYPKFLTLPFATADSHIQAGWFYNSEDTSKPRDQAIHKAINYIAPKGTQVFAAADGMAMASCQPLPPSQIPTSACGRNLGSPFRDKFGNFVLIDHGNGISTLYAHLDTVAEAINTCPPEERQTCPPLTPVSRGQPIGVVGSSGTTFDHLHFEAADNSAGTYTGHILNRIDPYDIYNKAIFYPPEAGFESSGRHHIWTSDPPAPASNVSPSPGPAPAGADGASDVGHTADIAVQAGASFDVTFNFTNSGNTRWREAQQYRLGRLSWDAEMGAPLRLMLDPSETVSPGETKQWTVQMTAPNEPGVYRQTWKMVRERVHWFGDQASIEVKVLKPEAVAVAAGFVHTCALTTLGGVKCWGSNFDGELGVPTADCDIFGIPDSCSTEPVDVTGLGSGAVAIGAGGDYTCAKTGAGGVKCWGGNHSGQLGEGTTDVRSGPVDVCADEACNSALSGVTTVATGEAHACALTSAGAVKCWGNNFGGQLGDGTTTQRTAPASVFGLGGGVAAIVAGGGHTCALTTVGGVKCWGLNFAGQLGDGTTVSRSAPVDVVGLGSGAVAISAGSGHTCAVTASGGVTCWGANRFGQLAGVSDLGSHPVPAEVAGLTTNMADVAAGLRHTCALTTGGGVKCWGDNLFGSLGDGAACGTRRCGPVDVVGLQSGVAAVAAGAAHTCALTTVGGVKCWGLNFAGQLGDGTMTSSTTPLRVVGLGN